eukprot:3359942-Prymnesium_polylepis.2
MPRSLVGHDTWILTVEAATIVTAGLMVVLVATPSRPRCGRVAGWRAGVDRKQSIHLVLVRRDAIDDISQYDECEDGEHALWSLALPCVCGSSPERSCLRLYVVKGWTSSCLFPECQTAALENKVY